MTQYLYSIYDRVAGIHRFPQFYRTAGQAIRACSGAVEDPQTELGKYPGDFELYEIGSMSDEKGILVQAEDQPKRICLLADLKIKAVTHEEER